MKKIPIFLLFLCFSISSYASHVSDSLLVVLDKVIAEREFYAQRKSAHINELMTTRSKINSLEERYKINEELIDNYQTFICDSAERFIHENIAIAKQLGNDRYFIDSRMRLSFVYSLSGLFVQANDVIRSIDYDKLDQNQKIIYNWNYIRYYENLIKYTDEKDLSVDYNNLINDHRHKVMDMLSPQSDVYRKELAFDLQSHGEYRQAITIMTTIFKKEQPNTHSYAMVSMCLAKLYRQIGDSDSENYFLKLAAITDTSFAVKENEALLMLATNLYHQGSITRSYYYIRAALDDANFYNSRFKNTVIARVQPIIERNYLRMIESQKRNLRLLSILLGFGILTLILTLTWNFYQMRIVSRARRELRVMNDQLVGLNQRLSEANTVKERYIGYFMTQCALYVNKLYAYRREVNHQIKSGHVENLYRPSAQEHKREVEELCVNFDEAFLRFYPDFVEGLNSLLESDAHYVLEEDGRLNTELRIFALMRLGITNINQIADFLCCSQQTIYNYKHRVKGRMRNQSLNIDDEIKKLGLKISPDNSN